MFLTPEGEYTNLDLLEARHRFLRKYDSDWLSKSLLFLPAMVNLNFFFSLFIAHSLD